MASLQGISNLIKRMLPGQGKALHTVSDYRGGWRRILEANTGFWQQNTEERQADLITYPTLYACLYRISSDIGKLPFTLQQANKDGTTQAVDNPAYSPVLAEQNNFQTEAQFREYWILSKLTNGNTYVLKRRDNRGVVVDLYVLDPCRVMPMVSDAGEVFYQLYIDPLNTIPSNYPAANLIVPASEIIHDRCMTVHNPLIGVPPLAAAHWPALKNMKIMRSATEFFANNSQPGGILTAPAGMSEQDAADVQTYWAANFSGNNAGKVAVIGADMKFTPFAMRSIDSQLIEQMKYSDAQICQPFGIKPYKIGLENPPGGWKPYDVNTEYYGDALQPHIEHMESLLNKGLRISKPLSVQLDLEPLLRMDEIAKAEVEVKLVAGKIKTPDEGRNRFNLAPTGGGDTLWGQAQDYPLGYLSQRNDLAAVSVTDPVADNNVEAPEEEPEEESTGMTERAIAYEFKKQLEALHAA